MERRPRPSLARACPVDAALEVIRGRWKGTILWHLTAGPMRPSAVQQRIPGVSERVLLQQLQELVADGVLERREHASAEPHVTYGISEYGRSLGPILEDLCRWGESHRQRTPSG